MYRHQQHQNYFNMKRYLIAAKAYQGDAELWFDENGKLIRIDIAKTNMHPEVMEDFKRDAPILESNLHEAFAHVKCTITEADIIITFEQFWAKYNKKINKARCLPIWNKMSQNEQLKAYTGIDKYNAYLKKEHWRNKLDPENYLRNKTWENEYR